MTDHDEMLILSSPLYHLEPPYSSLSLFEFSHTDFKQESAQSGMYYVNVEPYQLQSYPNSRATQ